MFDEYPSNIAWIALQMRLASVGEAGGVSNEYGSGGIGASGEIISFKFDISTRMLDQL